MNWKKSRIIKTTLVGLLAGLIIAGCVFFVKISLHGKFSLGTFVAGIDVSNKTPAQATETLFDARKNYLEKEITIEFGNKRLTRTAKELGLDILVEETVKTLKETDAKEMNIFRILFGKSDGGTKIGAISTINVDKFGRVLEENFELNKIAPTSATFYFDESNRLQIKKEKRGFVIEEDKLVKNLRDLAKNLQTKTITILPKEAGPPITATMLLEREEEMKEALRHQFSLLDPIYSDDWHTSLIEHLDWVRFVEKHEFTLATQKTYIAIEIDQEKLNEYIDAEISKWLDVPSVPVDIYTDRETGEIVIEGTGIDGLKIQRNHLKRAIELAVAERIGDIPIPVITLPPQIIISEDLQKLGIKERLGIGHTSYYGSPANRVHNIKVGSSQFNGVLVAPDEIFSFNKTLGPVDGSTGYLKELVIKPEGTRPEYGGGVCQVSTTMYRAILLSGLPVVERHPHSYAVSYYSQVSGHGLDATIYLGGPNLKFQNDTGRHILIQTYVKDDYELYFVFYGTSDGRSVEMEGPYLSDYHSPGPTVYVDTTEIPAGTAKQVEKAHTGFTALWYRYLTDPEGRQTIETLSTKYKAVPAKILKGVEVE